MPQWPNSGRYGWCKWCGDPIPKVIDGKASSQRMWHPACVREYELHTRLSAQLDYLVKRDGLRCACCPEGVPIPRRWVNHGEVVAWQSPPPFRHLATVGSDEWLALVEAWHRDNPAPRYSRVSLVDWIEVDHRVPLWEVADLPDDERRWYFGPGNLWLLCGPHHREKTAREAKRRAWLRRLEKAQLSLDL